jgi:hypothetical protein
LLIKSTTLDKRSQLGGERQGDYLSLRRGGTCFRNLAKAWLASRLVLENRNAPNGTSPLIYRVLHILENL